MLKYLVTAHAVLKYEPECSSKPDPSNKPVEIVVVEV